MKTKVVGDFLCESRKETINMAEIYSSQKKQFLNVEDVSGILDISKRSAYRIIKKLNDNLNKSGKITIPGKISSKYFYENVYL